MTRYGVAVSIPSWAVVGLERDAEPAPFFIKRVAMKTIEEQLLRQFVNDHRTELLKALVYLLSRKDAPISPETAYQLYCLLEES